MKTKQLRPIRENPKDWEAIHQNLVDLFLEEIYLPLIADLKRKKRDVLQNSFSDLVEAIADGKIQYVTDHYEGQFNAFISRELMKLGARWSKSKGWWMLPETSLTYEMRSASAIARVRAMEMTRRLDKTLEDIDPDKVASKLDLKKLVDQTIYRTNETFEESVEAIGIGAPKLTPEQVRRLSTEYTRNMQLSIRGWTNTEVQKLRTRVQEVAFAGGRHESLVKEIRDSYGESERKAKFLARQETNLLMTKFKQTRYEEAGVRWYRWQCVAGSGEHPVRPLHKKNDGKIYTWDNPPTVDDQGNRKNPGQDFNCRCVAVPIVRF